jgi:hypothetical protein
MLVDNWDRLAGLSRPVFVLIFSRLLPGNASLVEARSNQDVSGTAGQILS